MPSTKGDSPKGGNERVHLRVSSVEQREQGTIETQQQYLERFAAERGLHVVGTYADDGVSGTIPFHERVEGRRLLEDAKAGKVTRGQDVLADDHIEIWGVGRT